MTRSADGPDDKPEEGPFNGKTDGGLAAGYGKAYEIIAAALQLAAATVLMLLLGQWLDGKFGTSPWLMIAGLAVGFAGGFYSFMRSIQKLANNGNTKDKQ